MNDPLVETNDGRRKPKGRSPSYPAIDLDTAILRARTLWDEERQHPASVETVVKHWGYRSLNGPASLTLAALKKFGLTDDEGTGTNRTARVSDLAVEILANPDEHARVAAMQRAAVMPKIHTELWEKYGNTLPSDANLHWELTRHRGFTETGAREFVPQYRATLEQAQLLGSATVSTQSLSTAEDNDEVEPQSEPEPEERSLRQRRKPSRMSEEANVLTIPLMRGRSVVVEGEFPITETDWNQMMAVLNAMKPGLVAEPQVSEGEPI